MRQKRGQGLWRRLGLKVGNRDGMLTYDCVQISTMGSKTCLSDQSLHTNGENAPPPLLQPHVHSKPDALRGAARVLACQSRHNPERISSPPAEDFRIQRTKATHPAGRDLAVVSIILTPSSIENSTRIMCSTWACTASSGNGADDCNITKDGQSTCDC